jgi:sugar transferase (PEP-CTERM/EpsH1 system associated)
MKILFLCHRFPFPPNDGGRIRSFNMIRHLSRTHSVVVASLAESKDELRQGSGLRKYCDDVIVEVMPPWLRKVQALGALATNEPSSVAYFRCSRLHARIKERLNRTHFDAILVHCAFVAQYVTDWHYGYRILDFCDLDSAKWADYSQQRQFPLSIGYRFESKKLERYEQSIIGHFDRCCVATPGELNSLRTLSSTPFVTVLPNGVDTEYFVGPNDRPAKATTVAFLGRMDYFPNVDGVCYFVRQVLPLIKTQVPDVEFRIVGSNPVSRVRKLSSVPGVVVTGHVPDVRAYLANVAATVVPLRIARGTQNKILESMAMGIAVVASPEAAKGTQAVAGKHLLIGSDPKSFARHVINLLESSELRTRLSSAARKNLEQLHTWPVSMRILDELLQPAERHQVTLTGL